MRKRKRLREKGKSKLFGKNLKNGKNKQTKKQMR